MIINESIINESFEEVRKALDDAKIQNREQGMRSNRKILVSKKDLDRATKIKDKIDSSVTIASLA